MSKAFKDRKFSIARLNDTGETVKIVELKGPKAVDYIDSRVKEVPKNFPKLWKYLLSHHLQKGEKRTFISKKNKQYLVTRVA